MKKKPIKIDFKRNNKIALRNFSEAVDFHDLVKTLLVRMIRRNHKNSLRCPIYTEFDPLETNKDYPDIWVELNGALYVWEIQEKVTKEWMKKIVKRYDDFTLIVVPLKDVFSDWEDRMLYPLINEHKFNPIRELRRVLEDYAI